MRQINHKYNDKVPTKEGFLSIDECRKDLKFHAENIFKDMTCPSITQGRIDSMRSVLDLLEEYNMTLATLEFSEDY